MLGIKGKLGEKEVYALEGRFHFYEGYSMKEVCYPFYVLKLLGVEQVVLTNACGVKIASAYFTGTTGDTLRGMCDTIRDKAVKPAVAVLVGKAEDKITMAVTVTKQAQEKGLKAGALVKEIAAIAGGKGGGKPDFAMAGLKDETKIDEALAAVGTIVKKALGE